MKNILKAIFQPHHELEASKKKKIAKKNDFKNKSIDANTCHSTLEAAMIQAQKVNGTILYIVVPD